MAKQPVFSDINLEFELPAGAKAVLIPKDQPCLFLGDSFIVYALLKHLPKVPYGFIKKKKIPLNIIINVQRLCSYWTHCLLHHLGLMIIYCETKYFIQILK